MPSWPKARQRCEPIGSHCRMPIYNPVTPELMLRALRSPFSFGCCQMLFNHH